MYGNVSQIYYFNWYGKWKTRYNYGVKTHLAREAISLYCTFSRSDNG